MKTTYTLDEVVGFTFKVDENKFAINDIKKALRDDWALEEDEREELEEALENLEAQNVELLKAIEDWINNN